MKPRLVGLLTLFLSVTLLAAQAQSTSKPATTSEKTPGAEIAQTISMITGVAISPLLGVSAVGAWQYFHAKTAEQKARLHWYANPFFWVPAMLLVIACFIKDTAGTVLPSALKKPLDVADAIEHKISGLVATGAFVPLAVAIFQAHNADAASLAPLGFAAIDFSWLYNAILIPIAMIAFFIVFLASNAINVLILLSPFTTVDAALKALRGALLASVAVTAWANPWMGAAWALVIIIFSYCIAGWSFRLSHFGLVFIWDFVTGRCKRFKPDNVANKVFLGRKIEKVPARTYGTLCRDGQGSLVLKYRPWLVFRVRTLILPDGTFEVGRGVFYSEILRIEGGEAKTTLLLPPRYLGHEDEVAKLYGFAGTRDVGLRAVWAWLAALFGRSVKTQPA